MIYLIGTLYIVICGYIINRLLNITEKHLIYNIGLSFITGAYCYGLFLYVYILLFKLQLSPIPHILFFITLILIYTLTKNLNEELNYLKQSFLNIKQNYLPNTNKELYLITLSISLIIISFVVLHGKNTPTNTDDASRLRAFTPFLVYTDHANKTTFEKTSKEVLGFIASNSVFHGFVPQLYWFIDDIDHFVINYIIIFLFLSFILILFFYPDQLNTSRYINILFASSIPLFIYHNTTTYADTGYIIPYTLGLFYLLKATNIRNRYLLHSALMFGFASFSKQEGTYMMINGFFVIMIYLIWQYKNGNKFMLMKKNLKYYLILLIPFIFLATKEIYAPSFTHILNTTKEITIGTENTEIQKQIQQVDKSQIFWIIRYSMFSSNNFGLIFWIFLFILIANYKNIFNNKNIWGLLLILITFAEIFYMFTYTGFIQTALDQTTIHRATIVLAVITAIYIAHIITQTNDTSNSINIIKKNK